MMCIIVSDIDYFCFLSFFFISVPRGLLILWIFFKELTLGPFFPETNYINTYLNKFIRNNKLILKLHIKILGKQVFSSKYFLIFFIIILYPLGDLEVVSLISEFMVML